MTPADGERPTIIFLHLGKTAGWTLSRVLNRNVSPNVRIGNPPNTPHGFLSVEPIRTFASWPEPRRARFRLVSAHMVYGLHEHVPRPSAYLTLLRKPVARAISGYHRVLETPTHRLHEAVAVRGMSLEDYLTSGVSLETDNSQTRAIAGDVDTPFGATSDELLQRALRNLDDHFPVVGLTERFDDLLLVLKRTYGWSNLLYVRANVTKKKAAREEIPPSTIELIKDRNRLDEQLYANVSERFQTLVDADAGFERDLESFRKRNARYQPWGHLTYTYPRRLREVVSRSRSSS
ncbi:MAG: hypothetical protein ACJ758_10440 [Actinomycetota bacterium]